MPIYLVRWPSLRASLVRARSEVELLDILDEVASPGDCSWQVYTGPLWIDCRVPARYKIAPRQPGRLRREEVEVTDVTRLDDRELVLHWPRYSDTAYETRQAILRTAFPRIAEEIASTGDTIDAQRMAAAVTSDLVEHGEAVLHRGVTFDEELRLVATRMLCLRRTRHGQFVQLDPLVVEDFCCGLARIAPEPDGLVRIATVTVGFEGRRASFARLSLTLRLRADRDGNVDPLHRADAYRDGGPEESVLRRFEARRNEAVHWQPDAVDRDAIERLVPLLRVSR